METDVNELEVLGAAVTYMAVGYLWYSPILFAKKWSDLMGWPLSDKAAWKERQKGMGQTMALAALAALLMAYILAHFLILFGVATAAGALQLALWAWLGFIAPVTFTNALFDRRSKALWAINAFYPLVGLIVMSLILQASR